MTKQELLDALKRHDWYYAYSDDHSVWQRGVAAERKLKAALDAHDCPFTMGDIHKTVSEAILEDHVEVSEGVFRKPEWGKVVASRTRQQLIEQEKATEILEWFQCQ